MSRRVRVEQAGTGTIVCRLTSHRRTLTETDVVTFVNLVGLHEPPFIDMEWVGQLPGSHDRRFAPAPLLISIGMGLVATSIMEVVEAVAERTPLGPFRGMVGLEAKVLAPAFPGDTLWVELEAGIERTTRSGGTLLALRHQLRNQQDEPVVDFTERVLFGPAATGV